jgi:hypothetical protein
MSYEAAIASFGGDDTTLAKSFIISLKNCHTQFLFQIRVLIICMTQDQLFHTDRPKVFTDNQMS